MNAEFHPAAADEVIAASVFYDRRVPGLGADFIDDVQRVTAILTEFPGTGREFREVGLIRYPFSVIYRLSPDSIWIVAVAHFRRPPGHWRNRVE